VPKRAVVLHPRLHRWFPTRDNIMIPPSLYMYFIVYLDSSLFPYILVLRQLPFRHAFSSPFIFSALKLCLYLCLVLFLQSFMISIVFFFLSQLYFITMPTVLPFMTNHHWLVDLDNISSTEYLTGYTIEYKNTFYTTVVPTILCRHLDVMVNHTLGAARYKSKTNHQEPHIYLCIGPHKSTNGPCQLCPSHLCWWLQSRGWHC
jgi:hypothetical protein